MRYSKGFKDSVLRKILPPNNRSVSEVAKETGVTETTLYNWINRYKDDNIGTDDSELSPLSRSPKEKLRLLLEGSGMKEEDLGAWLRENGLHSEHLNLYEQELRDIVNNQNKKYEEENKRLKKEKRKLEKELQRKEKALAEMSALLVLKKKADTFWGDSEDA